MSDSNEVEIDSMLKMHESRGDRQTSSSPPKVTRGEEMQIRAQYERVDRGRSGRVLHPFDEEAGVALCETEQVVSGQSKWRGPRPFDSYPVGYKPICRRCGAVWRKNQA